MVIFYKKWKKYNEIQLTKKKMDLNIRKMINHPPSPVTKIYKSMTSPKWLLTLADLPTGDRYSPLLLLLLNKIGNASPGEGDWHPISPKTPAPHYQPIEEKKRRENSWRQKRREQLGQQKGIRPALETHQSHTIEYGVNQIVPDTERGIKVMRYCEVLQRGGA